MIPLHPVVYGFQGADRFFLTGFHTGAAADTAVLPVFRFCHSHDAKIMHPDLGAVIGTPGQGHLYMKVIGKYRFFNLKCKFAGIVAGIGTDLIAHAGRNIPGTRRRISAARLVLVNPDALYDGL